MIRFFQRIRHELVEQGNMKRYLKYSIGEILLVMIGILLALQVNTWNENNKIKTKATTYLKHILNDLSNEASVYAQIFELHKKQEKQFKDGIDMLYEIQNNHSDATEFFNKFGNAQYDDLIPYDATYREIISSGDFGIFENDTLIKNIINYYSENYDVAAQIKEFNETVVLERSLAKVTKDLYHMKYLSPTHKYPEMFDDDEWSYLNDQKISKI